MKTQKTASLKLFATAALVAGFVGTSASAALVAADLNTGGLDTGWSAGWAGSSNRMIVTASDLTYANYGITQTGTTDMVYGGNNTHADRMDSRTITSAMSGEVWFSILVNVPQDGGFAGISFDDGTPSPAYSHNNSDLRIVMSPTELWIDWEGGATNAAWTADATVGGFSAGTHLLLGKMNIGAGNDSIDVWVDPDVNAAGGPGGLGAADYSNATVDFMDSIAAIGVPLHMGTNTPVNPTPIDTADAIRVSDTVDAFEDVTGVVPEPGSLALLGLGGLLIARRRRG